MASAAAWADSKAGQRLQKAAESHGEPRRAPIGRFGAGDSSRARSGGTGRLVAFVRVAGAGVRDPRVSGVPGAGESYQRQIQRALVDCVTVDEYSFEERHRKKPHRYKPAKALLRKLKAARKRAMKKLYMQQQQGQLNPVPPTSDGGTGNPASTDNLKQINPARALGVGPGGQGGGYVTPFSYGTSEKKPSKKQNPPKPRQAKVTKVQPKKGKRY